MDRTDFAGSRQRVLILGGGFGGAYAAKRLAKVLPRGWEITLIDRNNFLVFYPLLVEAGVGSIEPRHVVVPIRYFVRDQDFRMAEVLDVDVKQQQVRYRPIGSGEASAVHYDHLVLALGSVTKLPPVKGLQEYGFQLKSLADSISLRDRAVRLLELANTIDDPAERKALLRVVVVGSNFTGIELAGEYQDFITDACKSYRNVKRSDISVTVLEYADRVLPALDEDLAGYAHRHLTQRGLDIRTKTSVTEVRPEEVVLTTGEVLPTHTCVWAAGIAPNPILDRIEGLPRDSRGWIECDTTLRVKGQRNVWAVGDTAHVETPDGKGYAATAQNATREGTVVANNIVRVIQNREPEPFVYSPVGSLAALGCRSAVAKVFGIKVAGFLAWWMYRTVYLGKMPSLSRKVRIVMDWTVDLFFARDIVQLGVPRIDPRVTQIPLDLRPAHEEKGEVGVS